MDEEPEWLRFGGNPRPFIKVPANLWVLGAVVAVTMIYGVVVFFQCNGPLILRKLGHLWEGFLAFLS